MSEPVKAPKGHVVGVDTLMPKDQFKFDPKTEPLAASMQRLKLFKKNEAEFIQGFDPKKNEYLVARLSQEGITRQRVYLSGQQVRDTQVLAAALSVEAEELNSGKTILDEQARRELRETMERYTVHTFNNRGKSTGSKPFGKFDRFSEKEDELIYIINDDYLGIIHAKTLEKKAYDMIMEDERKRKSGDTQVVPASGTGKTGGTPVIPAGGGSKPGGQSMNIPSLPEGLRNLDELRSIGTLLAQTSSELGGSDVRTLEIRNASVAMGGKKMVSGA